MEANRIYVIGFYSNPETKEVNGFLLPLTFPSNLTRMPANETEAVNMILGQAELAVALGAEGRFYHIKDVIFP